MPLLAKNKCRTGRLWGHVCDDRSIGGRSRPAAIFYYSPSRECEDPERQLMRYSGICQADAYAGFERLYVEGRHLGPIKTARRRCRGCSPDGYIFTVEARGTYWSSRSKRNRPARLTVTASDSGRHARVLGMVEAGYARLGCNLLLDQMNSNNVRSASAPNKPIR